MCSDDELPAGCLQACRRQKCHRKSSRKHCCGMHGSNASKPLTSAKRRSSYPVCVVELRYYRHARVRLRCCSLVLLCSDRAWHCCGFRQCGVCARMPVLVCSLHPFLYCQPVTALGSRVERHTLYPRPCVGPGLTRGVKLPPHVSMCHVCWLTE